MAPEAGGYSEPWMFEASELGEEGALSRRVEAGMEGAVAGVALGRGTGKRGLRWEEGREVETIPTERKGAGAEEERNPGQKVEVGQR